MLGICISSGRFFGWLGKANRKKKTDYIYEYIYIRVYIYTYIYIPWGSKDHQIDGRSEETIVSIRIYNQQLQGTIPLMFFDSQGIYIYYPGSQPPFQKWWFLLDDD